MYIYIYIYIWLVWFNMVYGLIPLISILSYLAGWWFQPYPSEKYEFVSWDDDIPN